MIEAAIIAIVATTTALNCVHIVRLSDRLRRLDTIMATHLELDKRYVKETPI